MGAINRVLQSQAHNIDFISVLLTLKMLALDHILCGVDVDPTPPPGRPPPWNPAILYSVRKILLLVPAVSMTLRLMA